MPPPSVPSTSQTDLTELRRRVDELDRRSHGGSLAAARARGVIGLSRRTEGMPGLTGVGKYYPVVSVGAAVEPGRVYRVAARLPVYSDGPVGTTNTLLMGRSFYTLDGKDATVTSTPLESTNVYLEGGNLWHPMTFEDFVDTRDLFIAGVLRVLFAVAPWHGDRIYGVWGADPSTAARCWIEDVGRGTEGLTTV